MSINYVNAPYFHNMLKDQVHSCQDFVVCFYGNECRLCWMHFVFLEAMNKVVQRSQMDLSLFDFWHKENWVNAQYYITAACWCYYNTQSCWKSEWRNIVAQKNVYDAIIAAGEAGKKFQSPTRCLSL